MNEASEAPTIRDHDMWVVARAMEERCGGALLLAVSNYEALAVMVHA